jgi:hypothetical protein
MGGKNKRGAHADTKTVMNKDYIDTVRLLLEAAPAVFHGSTFAMKGGTAINLFACAVTVVPTSSPIPRTSPSL